MPEGTSRPAAVKVVAACAALLTAAACTPTAMPKQPASFGQEPADGLHRLVSDLGRATGDAKVLTVWPGSGICGQPNPSVVRDVLPERVLFATASAEPVPDAAGMLNLLADSIRRNAPGAEVTVLGHTDAVGSDAYNIDLSRRRALTVLSALATRGLDPARLSAIAIGKRQPVAGNDTAEGRARNRRVEFLISGCLAANLGLVPAETPAADDLNTPANPMPADLMRVDLVRLDPAAANGLATVATISLRQPGDVQPVSAQTPPPPVRLPVAGAQVDMARPAPAPHYLPKTLAPDAQRNPLGPAVPY